MNNLVVGTVRSNDSKKSNEQHNFTLTQKNNVDITGGETRKSDENTVDVPERNGTKLKTCSYYVKGKCKHGIKGKKLSFQR